MKPVVVLGVLGSTLDVGKTADRWSRWRPTVALCQQPDLLVSRFELLHERAGTALAQRLVEDIHQVSPETGVRPRELTLSDPWDFEEVYGALLDFARAYPFKPEDEDYLVHITTGTHVIQICWFLLAESGRSRRDCCRPDPDRGATRRSAPRLSSIWICRSTIAWPPASASARAKGCRS